MHLNNAMIIIIVTKFVRDYSVERNKYETVKPISEIKRSEGGEGAEKKFRDIESFESERVRWPLSKFRRAHVCFDFGMK